MSVFRRLLSPDECAVVVKRGREPQLVRGAGSVRTFGRWKRVVVVDRKPFVLDIPPETVMAKAGVPVTVSARVEGQIVDPVTAALKVVDYEDATRTIARTAIRAVMKDHPASDLASASGELEAAFVQAVENAAESWGVSLLSGTLHTAGS
jgi:regulator of protease activity HflC (stomatin/prohibitin superfamily)